jgi:hypothetical protein
MGLAPKYLAVLPRHSGVPTDPLTFYLFCREPDHALQFPWRLSCAKNAFLDAMGNYWHARSSTIPLIDGGLGSFGFGTAGPGNLEYVVDSTLGTEPAFLSECNGDPTMVLSDRPSGSAHCCHALLRGI